MVGFVTALPSNFSQSLSGRTNKLVSQAPSKVGSSKFIGSLHDSRAGTIQPLAYCRGLARKAKELGAKIYEKSKVSRIRKQNGMWQTYVQDIEINSKYLLLAMNAYQD